MYTLLYLKFDLCYLIYLKNPKICKVSIIKKMKQGFRIRTQGRIIRKFSEKCVLSVLETEVRLLVVAAHSPLPC